MALVKLRIVAVIVIILIIAVLLYLFFNKKTYPKIIWSYWHTEELPVLQKNILKRRERLLPTYSHVVVTKDSLSKHLVRKPPAGFYDLKPQAQSDWVRLALLKEHGGCWMDIAIIINSPADFDLIYKDSIESGSDVTGFYLEPYIMPGKPLTFFESWFILAPKGSSLIHNWLHQFEKAIDIGFDKYRTLTEKPYECENIYTPFGPYLTVHVAFRVALKDMYFKPNIIAYRADDTMYKLKMACGLSNPKCVMERLRDDPSTKKIPFIKLGGGESESKVDISKYFDE